MNGSIPSNAIKIITIADITQRGSIKISQMGASGVIVPNRDLGLNHVHCKCSVDAHTKLTHLCSARNCLEERTTASYSPPPLAQLVYIGPTLLRPPAEEARNYDDVYKGLRRF